MSIFDHLYFRELSPITNDKIKISNLRQLIRDDLEGREIDAEIGQIFPLAELGNPDTQIRIEGSKSLLNSFNEIDAEKIDLTETLNNIEFIGFSDKKEVILNFVEDGWSATGIYDFSNEFLDEIFHMGKYAKFCLDLDQQDLIKDNIKQMQELIPETEKQYRFLMSDDEILIRGLTSTRYNCYDNHLAMYIVLYNLHKYATEQNIMFRVTKGFLSDSEIRIYFEQTNPISIEGVGNVKFGAYLQNSEIKDSKLYFEFRYELSDMTNPNKIFAARPDINDAILQIQHSKSLKNLSSSIQRIWHLNEMQQTMIDHIRRLRQVQHLSEDTLYWIYRQIIRSRDSFSTKTRDQFRLMYDGRLIDNTLSIIEAFDLINTITTNIEERILLERIYHRVLTDITNER